jgi:hypothetical protein
MKTKLQDRSRRRCGLLLVTLLVTAWATALRAQDTAPPKVDAKNAAIFAEFEDRVQKYVSIHKSVASSLPSLKPTALPEMITAHQQALARKIREARPNAKRGDVFTEATRKGFRALVREEFQGPHGHGARTTIRQGEPLKSTHLHVNEPYPDGVPFTTVPPTLLLKFPKLPEQVAYRIVVQDLILLDVEANLVIDRIPDIFPDIT